VARGTQHLRKRPREPQQRPVDRKPADVRRSRRLEEEGMFFPSLRRHARWVFVLLALVFAGSFVFLGVGSGSNGLGDILNGWLNTGGSSGPSVSKLEKRTRSEPQNATAFRELATAYETAQRNDDAIVALERYTVLKPKDADSLQELAGLYQRALSDLGTTAQAIQAATPTADRTPFTPPATSPFGRAYASPTGLQDPLSQAITTQVSSSFAELQTKASGFQAKLLDVDRRVVALDPNNPTAQFQLAQVADGTSDTKTAIAAYKRFLVLSPDDPLVGQVKQRLKQLTAPASSASG
jgi:tetratricopeptide (TPR) repeat protein